MTLAFAIQIRETVGKTLFGVRPKALKQKAKKIGNLSEPDTTNPFKQHQSRYVLHALDGIAGPHAHNPPCLEVRTKL
jgi:hypothetical protein